MIFKQWQQVLDGTKTQTRRLVQKGELLKVNNPPYSNWPFPPTVLINWRLKWMVGKTYAVQPGRGQKAVGRFRITEIRRERSQDISEGDVIAEGIFLKHGHPCTGWSNGLDNKLYPRARMAFKALWNSINKKSGSRWDDNPDVWVLEFEVME